MIMAYNPLLGIYDDTPQNSSSSGSPYSDTWKGALDSRSERSDLDYEDFIKSLSNVPNAGSKEEDFFKQMIDILINWQHEKDQRKYNESWRDEERAYNTPTAALGRLLATGMSRDAALQMLSGSSSGGGTTASPASGDTGLNASSLSPSESRLNSVQADTAIANTIFNGLNTATSLIGLGFSANTAIKQATMLATQNRIMSDQTNATDSAGRTMAAITSAMANGAQPTDDDLMTQQSLLKWLKGAVDSYPVLQTAIEQIESNGNNNPYFVPTFTEAFQNWHNARGLKQSPTLAAVERDRLFAESTLAELRNTLVSAEIDNVKMGTSKQIEELALIGQQSRLVEAQTKLTEEQAEQAKAITQLTNEQTIAQQGENTLNKAKWTAYDLKADDLVGQYVDRIVKDVTEWSVMRDEDIKADIQAKVRADVKYARALAVWNLNCQSSLDRWSVEAPKAYKYALVYNNMHFGDIVKAACESDMVQIESYKARTPTLPLGIRVPGQFAVPGDDSNFEMLLSTFISPNTENQ